MSFPKKYDVFISYAIEDKYPVAESIALHLKQHGIKVWYVGNELKVGDLISTVIGHGLRNSTYCILILSPFYIRHWTVVELYRFIEKEQIEKKILILPVWHNMDYGEAKKKYPILADRYALSTEKGLDAVSNSLLEVIRKKKKSDSSNAVKRFATKTLFSIACAMALFSICQKYFHSPFPLPSRQFVQNAIEKRTTDFQTRLENDMQRKLAMTPGEIVPIDSVIAAYNNFIRSGKHERNEYRFTGDNFLVSGSRNIADLGISVDNTPYDAYGISFPVCYHLENHFHSDSINNYSFTIMNHIPLSFTIDTLFESGGKAHARIAYSQNIRCVEGTLACPKENGQARKQQIELSGYKPSEEYIFEMKNGSWGLSEIK